MSERRQRIHEHSDSWIMRLLIRANSERSFA
jgi:hypothetical protein